MEPAQSMKRVFVIYVPSVIHWVGAFTAIGLIKSLFGIPLIAVVSLSILAMLCLPIPFTIETQEEDE